MKFRVVFFFVLALAVSAQASTAEKPYGWIKLPHVPARVMVNDPRNIRFEVKAEAYVELSENPWCLTREWEWGDDSMSRQTSDCDPADNITKRARFSQPHTYRSAGLMRVVLRLKRLEKIIFIAETNFVISDGTEDVTGQAENK